MANLDDSFWERYWSDPGLTSHDFFSLVSRQDVHDMMDKASGNLTALCFKVTQECEKYNCHSHPSLLQLVSRIGAATAIGCSGVNEQTAGKITILATVCSR